MSEVPINAIPIEGACHCRNIQFRLSWPATGGEIAVRNCGCSFCQKHAGAWTSHRNAILKAKIGDPSLVTQYRFGSKTADFYVCSECGVVPFVLCEINENQYAVVNVNTFDTTDELSFSRSSTNFDGEATGSRLERRKLNWIPNVEISAS